VGLYTPPLPPPPIIKYSTAYNELATAQVLSPRKNVLALGVPVADNWVNPTDLGEAKNVCTFVARYTTSILFVPDGGAESNVRVLPATV
jgi:hypothetical protein